MPVVVAAYLKKGNTRTIVHYTQLHELGPYELIVPKGNYHIVAFGDKNRNLIYEKGEAVGQYAEENSVFAPAGGVVGDLDILISSLNTGKIDFPTGSVMPSKKSETFHSTSPGAIADLDDVLFSDDYGNKGFWTPLEFFKEVGGNIYFLEAYDPEKIPILFVHGAAGSPQNWKAFFENIDRVKFQPWFFYYPSGASINAMSHLLYWKLLNLQLKYKFKELYITAHSMGGLVVRSFIVNFGNLFPSITNFISISTPWGGEELAKTGVKYSPAVIPAWRDMQPESELIKSIFRKRMPPTIEHFLFFGHKGNRNLLRQNNDKVVTLASQLDQRSQREAKMIYGFNEDHVSILSSEQVLSQYSAVLAASSEKTRDAVKALGNRLRVDFEFDLPKELPRPRSALLLRPVDKNRPVTWLYLGNEDAGQKHGPFPSGKYEVSLIASAFAPKPSRIPVTIEKGRVPSVKFSMNPRGQIYGYVVNTKNSINQAGEYQRPDTDVQVKSITLRGGGITRNLIPTKKEDFSFFDHYLSGTDYVADGAFYFFGLSAGKYELTINAAGYEQYSEIRHVRPGQYGNEMVIELVKKNVDDV
jgi:pimeloyl-ACP methyl ester carboxylesterase